MSLELPDFHSFDSTVAALFSRVRGHIEPGAHRMQTLIQANTIEIINKIPTILVAGTNGKGTTCALLEQSFRDAGYRTALYTSPHLVSPTERIRFNGEPISKEIFLESARLSFDLAKIRLPDATFFELMTAIALSVISQKKVEVFICEVGLGGRLDSTNILNPRTSVLTSVGLDHTEWLGCTEEAIAFEKSFISRRNRGFVIGQVSEAAKRGIEKAMHITGAAPVFLPSETDPFRAAESIARVVVENFSETGGPKIHPEKVSAAKQRFFWPGRFDIRQIDETTVLFDAAHNAHGVDFLMRQCLDKEKALALPRPWILVYATLGDKDWQTSIDKLHSQFEELHFTQTLSPRAVHPEALLQYTCSINPGSCSSGYEESSEALMSGLKIARQKKGTLFILGSITLLGEAMEFFSLPVFPPHGSSPK
jgi:dihydrofolate synthase/folylpolyglutamate synthase